MAPYLDDLPFVDKHSSKAGPANSEAILPFAISRRHSRITGEKTIQTGVVVGTTVGML